MSFGVSVSSENSVNADISGGVGLSLGGVGGGGGSIGVDADVGGGFGVGGGGGDVKVDDGMSGDVGVGGSIDFEGDTQSGGGDVDLQVEANIANGAVETSNGGELGTISETTDETRFVTNENGDVEIHGYSGWTGMNLSEDVDGRAIREAIDYENMPYCSTRTAVRTGEGQWKWLQGFHGDSGDPTDTFSMDTIFVETSPDEKLVVVTKNYMGPTCTFYAHAGLIKFKTVSQPNWASLDLHAGEIYTDVGISDVHAELNAKVTVLGGEASLLNFNLGVGLSSEIGIKQDSLALKLLGCGLKIGRKLELSIFDNSFGIDIGKIFS